MKKKPAKKPAKKINYPKSLTIRVTKGDIAEGLRLSAAQCPIAMAVQRMGYCDARVGTGTAFLSKLDRIDTQYPLPVIARTFIRKFDNALKVLPFKFTLKQIKGMHDRHRWQ